MNYARKRVLRRLVIIALFMTCIGMAGALALRALSTDITFFMTPSDLLSDPTMAEKRSVRLGGLVVKGSLIQPDTKHPAIGFHVTDTVNEVMVIYHGVVPDLFREGQGVVAEGRMVHNEFIATRLLAKHDENYMPPEVAKGIEKAKQ